MPRKAKPRARRRRLEGLDRVNAIFRSGYPPYANQADCDRQAAEWLEIRDEVIASGATLSTNWSFRVFEAGDDDPPPRESVLHLATDGPITDEDRAHDLAIRTDRSRRTAAMARAAWETLTKS